MDLSIACRAICMGRSLGRLYGTSLGRQQGMSLGVTYRAILGRPQDVDRRRPRDVGRGCPLALHIGPYGEVPWTLHFHILGTSAGDVLRTSAGEVPWRYIEDHTGTSTGRLSGTCSGRPRDIILPSRSGPVQFCLISLFCSKYFAQFYGAATLFFYKNQ